VNLKCPVCGSKLAYDPERRRFSCDRCGWMRLEKAKAVET